MSAFIVIAAVMLGAAIGAVAWPLWRARSGRVGVALGVVLAPLVAAGLYLLWSNWDWRATAPAPQAAGAPDVGAMVAKLAQHLRAAPEDLPGWLMLGRSYLALQRYEDARIAYEQASNLAHGANVEALLGLGEAVSLRAGGQITPQAAQLFEDALRLAPQNPKALLFGGFAAANRGDPGLARRRWEALKAMNPPPQIVQMLDARIAALGFGGGDRGAGDTAAASGEARVRITISAALAGRIKPATPMFVFAREPGVAGPPLAVKRLSAAALGTQVDLSAADSMVPGKTLLAGHRVSITARISFAGQPIAARGDLFGELTYDIGKDGVRDLTIDQVAQ